MSVTDKAKSEKFGRFTVKTVQILHQNSPIILNQIWPNRDLFVNNPLCLSMICQKKFLPILAKSNIIG